VSPYLPGLGLRAEVEFDVVTEACDVSDKVLKVTATFVRHAPSHSARASKYRVRGRSPTARHRLRLDGKPKRSDTKSAADQRKRCNNGNDLYAPGDSNPELVIKSRPRGVSPVAAFDGSH
jgi:hypothetical protein